MDLVSYFKNTYQDFKEESVITYKGEFTQEIVHSFSSIVGHALTFQNAHQKVKRKVYHVLVEFLQNICKHSDYNVEEAENQVGYGTVIFAGNENEFAICTVNPIKKEAVEILKETLEHINSLDKAGLKELYKFMIKKGRLSERGGAGLGYIDIAKKNLKPYQFEFVEENGQTNFILCYHIDRMDTSEEE